MKSSHCFQSVDCFLAQHLLCQTKRELVEAGGDRRVSGEDAAVMHCFPVCFDYIVQPFLGMALLQQSQCKQGGMTFVHVIGLHFLVSQSSQHSHPAQTQHDLLAQAVMQVASVEAVSEGLVPGAVFRKSRIQEKDRYSMLRDTMHHIAPRTNFYRSFFYHHGDMWFPRI